ncbi:hypothetical protein Rumeso_02221 [Rubellimicrobium mesophilum DSM 19309]|uniref:Uncharacterized protein n=1 Tax=Rubellimicrobium mesophilum DSM 19309 TaxID=442562 RepID=A0A017HR28_9RHOB|nr:hypothetical protein Rumeso_02221 [Rubellimicrobium mesophilum DSM 19309]
MAGRCCRPHAVEGGGGSGVGSRRHARRCARGCGREPDVRSRGDREDGRRGAFRSGGGRGPSDMASMAKLATTPPWKASAVASQVRPVT